MTLPFTDVVVEDCGVDACLLTTHDGQRMLVVSPHQTFGFAAKAIARLAPEATDSEIRAMLRTRLPNSIDVDELIERRHAEDAYQGTWAARFTRLLLLLVATLLLIGTALMFTSGSDHGKWPEYLTGHEEPPGTGVSLGVPRSSVVA